MLDTDFYKFTMQQVVFKKFPDVEVEFTFKNRTKGIKLKYDDYYLKLQTEIQNLCNIVFQNQELDYLESLGIFSKGYLNFLQRFRYRLCDVDIIKGKEGELQIKIHGTWLNTILWEVPLLAIISELCTNQHSTHNDEMIGQENLFSNIKYISRWDDHKDIRFADFGTRRRYSREWQEYIVNTLTGDLRKNFVGTSNVLLAMKYGVKPIGTMAHEFIQAMQQISGCQLRDSQKCAFQTWADVYRGDLGIALSDTLGMNTFFNDFDMYFSKLFDGARHDSGDPYIWCDKLIKHYKSMGIDPLTKTAVFSDGLTFPKMVELHKHYKDKIKVSFGIGTNLTNDCGIKPLQIVIKMTKCNGRPVAKISDSKGKQMCEDREYLKHLCNVFKIPQDRI